MKQRPSLLNSDSGLSLIELLAATLMAMILLGMTLSVTLANREAYGFDVVRTRLNQNIRGAFTVIATEIRQAGERLPSSFPAVEVINGTSGNWDELILRRNYLDEVATLCVVQTAGGTAPLLHLASGTAGLPPACSYGSQTTTYNSWRTRRLAQPGGRMTAMIYDFSTRLGEMFTYTTEANTSGSSTMTLTRQVFAWTNAYTVGTAGNTAMYAIHEWRFRRTSTAGQTDCLEIIQNGDTANAQKLAFGLTDFSVSVNMQDSTTKTAFARTDNWTRIQNIQVTISGAAAYRGRPINTSLTMNLLPRNIMSN